MSNEDKIVQLNLDVPEGIRRKLKAEAAMRGVPLKAFVVEILTEFGPKPPGKGRKRPFVDSTIDLSALPMAA